MQMRETTYEAEQNMEKDTIVIDVSKLDETDIKIGRAHV